MRLPPENVQDYPRPPRLEPVPFRIEIALAGETVSATTRAFRVVETHLAPTYYLPPADVFSGLRALPGKSFCEWKGTAQYFDVMTARHTARRAAWCYPTPTQAFGPMAGYVAFYASAMDHCFVDTVRARPQPGHSTEVGSRRTSQAFRKARRGPSIGSASPTGLGVRGEVPAIAQMRGGGRMYENAISPRPRSLPCPIPFPAKTI